ARCVRAIRGTRYQAAGWQLEDETTAVAQPLGGEVEFPLTINSQDAKGNILKMRLQLGVPKPELPSNHSHDSSNGPVAVYVHGTAQLPIASRPNRTSDH